MAGNKPTHRCPRCAGTSQIDQYEAPAGHAQSFKVLACPVCTPYGPFGLVPEAVAIETALILDGVPAREQNMQKLELRGDATMDWLLNDTRVGCEHCDGTGMWSNPFKRNDSRPCYHCNGKGYLR